jgi:hypothetical protein
MLMGFDPARVVEVYLRDPAGKERVGSGYLVSDRLVLTAGHVIAGLPAEGTEAPDRWRCEVRPLGLGEWLPARLEWWNKPHDIGLLRLDDDWRAPVGSPAPRWGRLGGIEPVACMAVGFPWAQARSDQVRDTEQLFGHVAPLTASKTGRLAINVVSTPLPSEMVVIRRGEECRARRCSLARTWSAWWRRTRRGMAPADCWPRRSQL